MSSAGPVPSNDRPRGAVSAAFARDIGELESVFQMVETFLGSGAGSKLLFPIQLALEEIFTNLVKYNAAGKSQIRIDLRADEGEVIIRVTDPDSPRFDITTDAPQVDIAQPLDKRTEGGLGIHLVKKIMDRIEYQHENRTSTLTLHKRMD